MFDSLLQRDRLPVEDMHAGIPAERANPDGVPVEDAGHAGEGACKFGRPAKRGYKVTGLRLPSTNSATARVIRAHELLHASKSPARRKGDEDYADAVCELAEDALVHAKYWTEVNLHHLNRDAYATALRLVRTGARLLDMVPPTSPQFPEAWDAVVRCAVLAAAISSGTGGGTYGSVGHRPARKSVMGAIEYRLGSRLYTDVDCIAMLARRGNYQRVREEIAKLLMGGHQPGDLAAEAGEGATHIDRGMQRVPGMGGVGGEERIGDMISRSLPLVLPCDPKMNQRTRASARTGARLNAGRLAGGVVNMNPAGMFRRMRTRPGGSVLIDASGSMSMPDEVLAELALVAPAASIAYYHSAECNRDDDVNGFLTVYASRGRRAERTREREGGGNGVDWPALLWLLDQPAPRVMVTDLHFCGGNLGEAQRAEALARSLMRTGALVVLPSSEAALEYFREMRDSAAGGGS